jgi:hypothetical protein
MISGATLGALTGFLGAIVTMGVPLAAFLYRVDRHAMKAVRLLTGEEEIEDDGVLPRLDDVEDQTTRHERVLQEEDMLPLTDGGPDVEAHNETESA